MNTQADLDELKRLNARPPRDLRHLGTEDLTNTKGGLECLADAWFRQRDQIRRHRVQLLGTFGSRNDPTEFVTVSWALAVVDLVLQLDGEEREANNKGNECVRLAREAVP